MRITILFFTLAFLGMVTGVGRASDSVEAALYLGKDARPRLLARVAPPPLAEKLHEVFGFRHYVFLKRDKITLSHLWTQWFMARKDFFIALRPLPPTADEPQLVDYEIYKDGFIVARGKYEPSEGTPLFINGPDFKAGRLILVLEPR